MARERKPYTDAFTDVPEHVSANDDPETLWRDARLLASQLCDVYSPAIAALTPILDERVDTMSVDKYYRCYYSHQYMLGAIEAANKVSKESPCESCGATSHHKYAYIAGVIYHEAQHPLRKHFERAQKLGVTADTANRWNVAADCEINDDALELFKELFREKNNDLNNPAFPLICLPPHGCLPELYGHPDHLLVEDYFPLLKTNKLKLAVNHGSGVTGLDSPWDVGKPTQELPGVDDIDHSHIEKEVAENILKGGQAGNKALGHMLDWAKSKIKKSPYNWKMELNRVVRISISRLPGEKKNDLSKIHKNSAGNSYKVILPGKVGVKSRVLVVIDTSGSMGGQRTSYALGELDKIFKTLRSKTMIVTGDTTIGKPQIVKSIYEIKFLGGGGTDMSYVVREAYKAAIENKFEPSLVILVTDGETAWPTKADVDKKPLIVCGINESKAASKGGLPSWIKHIWIPVKGNNYHEDEGFSQL